MFGFLKKKLSSAVSKFSKDIEEKGEETIVEQPKASELVETKAPEKEESEEVKEESPESEAKKESAEEEAPKEKKGFFARIREKISGPDIPDEEDFKEEVQDKIKETPEFPKKIEVESTQEEKEPKAEPKETPEVKAEVIEQTVSQTPKPKETPQPVKEVKETPEPVKEIKEATLVEVPEVKEEKKGFFSSLKEKIVTKKISEQQFEDMFWDLEVVLLENNVAVEVIEKIKEQLKEDLVDKPLKRGEIPQIILNSLKHSIEGLFEVEKVNLLDEIKKKKPFVICLVGINGSGKTTTIAKLTHLLKKNNLSCVLAAADTFRAAAIDQLQLHADKLDVKLIKHDYGSDPAAVAHDAIAHAKSKDIDVVLIDTAGRIHSNINLMDEMQKIIRVADPDMKIFIGESITGNDCTEQAKKFDESIGLDGIILSKADIDEKGGSAISISYVTGKPILYLGTGQGYEDLEPFDSEKLMESLGL